MNVERRTMSQPTQNNPVRNIEPTAFSTFHTTLVIGCHCQHKRPNNKLAINTKVLRSTDWDTIFVHHFLKPGRAITLCWIAKRPRNTAFISRAWAKGPSTPESIDFGTSMLPTKPLHIRALPKKQNMQWHRTKRKLFYPLHLPPFWFMNIHFIIFFLIPIWVKLVFWFWQNHLFEFGRNKRRSVNHWLQM